MKKALKIMLLPLLAVIAIMVACNKSDELSTEEALDEMLYSIQERGGVGRFGCYELMFPVTLSFSDSSTVEVNSYDEMKQAIRAFIEANGPTRPHPSFVFPVSVMSQDGDIITLNSESELRTLRAACRDRFGHHDPHGHSHRRLTCFEIVFPVTIEFPDGSTAQADDRQELHQLIRTWRHDNPSSTERPHLAFPLTVKMTEDGTLVTVNSRDELRDLKENCD